MNSSIVWFVVVLCCVSSVTLAYAWWVSRRVDRLTNQVFYLAMRTKTAESSLATAQREITALIRK